MADAIVLCSHKYQQLPLIPVEEFLAQFPEHADDDENALMFARIDHERSVREGLEQQRQELLKRKQKLIADNKRRKEDLANLDNDLEKFIDVGPSPISFYSFLVVGTTANRITIGGETDSEAIREGSLRLALMAHGHGAVLEHQTIGTQPITMLRRAIDIIIIIIARDYCGLGIADT
jgi:hypothetical protein